MFYGSYIPTHPIEYLSISPAIPEQTRGEPPSHAVATMAAIVAPPQSEAEIADMPFRTISAH